MSHLGRPRAKRIQNSPRACGCRLKTTKKRFYLLNQQKNLLSNFLRYGSKSIYSFRKPRFDPKEKKNDLDFAQYLAQGFDVYVNDAFGTVHRAHASVVAVAEQFKPEDRFAGFLISSEIAALSKVKDHPKAPFTVVMGGSKVSDKITVILNLLINNHMLIGGAMAYTFLGLQRIK